MLTSRKLKSYIHTHRYDICLCCQCRGNMQQYDIKSRNHINLHIVKSDFLLPAEIREAKIMSADVLKFDNLISSSFHWVLNDVPLKEGIGSLKKDFHGKQERRLIAAEKRVQFLTSQRRLFRTERRSRKSG